MLIERRGIHAAGEPDVAGACGVSHPGSLREPRLGPCSATIPLGCHQLSGLSLLLQHFPLVMDGNFPAWVKSNFS